MVIARTLAFSPSAQEWEHGDLELDSLPSLLPRPHDSLLDLKKQSTKLPSCFIFVDESFIKEGDGTRELLRLFNIPSLVSTEFGARCNGYFGSQGAYDKAGQIQSYSTWFRCLVKIAHLNGKSIGYRWFEMTFFSHWQPDRSIILCVDTPDDFPSQLADSMKESLDLGNPFALHIPLLDRIIEMYDQSVWGIRNLIRGVEKSREISETGESDFSTLHEISRHATHSTETLVVTAHSLEAMQQRYSSFHKSSSPDVESTQQYMDFQMQLIRNLKLRSRANQERLQGEITLAYNTITQKDSRIMVQIGESAKSDSAAMKTVAVVTMAFLPATFTSAVFGMGFFEFQPGDETKPDEWRVSSEIWQYWVVSGLLTGLTILAWVLWNGRKSRNLLLEPFWKFRLINLRRKLGGGI